MTRALLLLPLLLMAGCRDELTQVVLVVQSDLAVPSEVDGMDVAVIEGPFAPPVSPFFSNTGERLGQFPLSIGFMSGGRTDSFSMVVRFFVGVFQRPDPTLVISRTVTDIRFADQQTKMLVLPMRRACACQGTACPSPGNPECDNLDDPALMPFNPTVAPPSSMMMAGGIGGGPIRSP